MNYSDYVKKRAELFNKREKGFQTIKQMDAAIDQLDKLYERTKVQDRIRRSLTSMARNILR